MQLKPRTIITILTTLLLLLLGPGITLAQEPEAEGPISSQADVSPTFIYQGELRQDGEPVDGVQCNFTFELWDDPQPGQGTQIGSQSRTKTPKNGRFSTELNFGSSAFTGEARFLQILVDCGEGQTQVGDRQPLRPAPYAIGLRPGATINGAVNSGGVLTLANSADDGLRINSAGGDGVQVTSANYGFYAQNTNEDGLFVGSAGEDGVDIDSAGDDGVQISSANYGVFVNSADTDGILVSEADADGDGIGVAGYFDGDVTVTGNLSKSGGGFSIDHPLDPANKTLTHSFVESPERVNVYNGNVTLDDNGEAWVQLPAYFEALNHRLRYQLTPIGGPGPNLYIAQEVQENRFKIAGGEAGLKVSWQVTGVRQDAWAEANPLQVETDKPAAQQGFYRTPEIHGQPASKAMHRAERARKGESR